jgi:hypothetical protein
LLSTDVSCPAATKFIFRGMITTGTVVVVFRLGSLPTMVIG